MLRLASGPRIFEDVQEEKKKNRWFHRMRASGAKSASPSREIQADYLFACSIGTAGALQPVPLLVFQSRARGLVMMTKVKGQHGARLQLAHVLFPKSQLAALATS